MKLKIKEAPKKEEDKEVVLSLEQAGNDIHLMLKKEGKAPQVVLKFLSSGTVNRIIVYEDIGFNTNNGKLEIL